MEVKYLVGGLRREYRCSDIVGWNENEITIYMVTKNLVSIDIVYENLNVRPAQIQVVKDRKFRDLESSYRGRPHQFQMKMKFPY